MDIFEIKNSYTYNNNILNGNQLFINYFEVIGNFDYKCLVILKHYSDELHCTNTAQVYNGITKIKGIRRNKPHGNDYKQY